MKWLKVLKLCGLALVATGFGLFLGGELTALETVAPTSAYQSSANSPITTGQPVRVRMRDGAELSGDLYLPAGEGPFPTLVRKSPYERDRRANDERIGTAHYFVANGYAVLIVSQRGRFGSDGIFHQARNEGWLEHKDGYDTIEWAAAQPWSNGKIGTYGISADGQWQLATGPHATASPGGHVRRLFCPPPHRRPGGAGSLHLYGNHLAPQQQCFSATPPDAGGLRVVVGRLEADSAPLVGQLHPSRTGRAVPPSRLR